MSWKERAAIGKVGEYADEKYKARIYLNRIAISKRDGERLTWEEVQEAKQRILGDMPCIEIYPAQCDVINLRHTRHLWHGQEISMIVQLCKHPEFEPQ